jgi:Kelch motif
MHRHNHLHQQQPPQHQGSTNRLVGGDGAGVYFDQQQQQQQIVRNRIGSGHGSNIGGGCGISSNRSMSVSASSSSSRRLFMWSKVHTCGNLYKSTDFLLSSAASSSLSTANVDSSNSAGGSSTAGFNGISLPPPRSGAASVVVKGKLYIFGGYGGGTGRLDDFWSYDYATQRWEEVTVLSVEKPGCRENNGVVISDSSRSIYLFGGYNGT